MLDVASSGSRFEVPQALSNADAQLSRQMRNSSIPDADLSQNAALYLPARSLKRLLLFHDLYRLALPVHGVMVQFGTRYGRDLMVMNSLRTLYEPFNVSRRIIGFDTFTGFPSVHTKDGSDPMVAEGSLSTPAGYSEELTGLLAAHQAMDPLPNMERCSIRKGDAAKEFAGYLQEHPETIIALAYFDMDIYEPTKACLQALKPRLTKGSVVAFDELNSARWPGETRALNEVFPLTSIRLRRSVLHSAEASYFMVE